MNRAISSSPSGAWHRGSSFTKSRSMSTGSSGHRFRPTARPWRPAVKDSIALWDLATGVRRSETEDTGGWVHRVAFSPDGRLLASASFESSDVTLSDPSTAKIVGKLTGHEGLVRALAFTRDGKTLLTGGADRTLRLWDVATRQPTGMLQGPKTAEESRRCADRHTWPSPIRRTARVATASEDGQVNVYGPAPNGLSRSWVAHDDATTAIAWSPDGKTLATAGFDRLVKIWNPADRRAGSHAHRPYGLGRFAGLFARRPDAGQRQLRPIDPALERGRRCRAPALDGHTATVRSLAFSHNDKLLASGGGDQTVQALEPGQRSRASHACRPLGRGAQRGLFGR